MEASNTNENIINELIKLYHNECDRLKREQKLIEEIECKMEEDKQIIIDNAIKYLKNNQFVPHKMGNYGRYGLNSFGSGPIIQYNNQLWKFLWFVSNSNNVVFIGENGDEFILNEYNLDGIIRMQEINENKSWDKN